MSGLDQLMRLQRWTLDEKRRRAGDLELLIERLIQDISHLDAAVEREIEASRANLELQRVLPGYRQVMKDRRARLDKSLLDLRGELDKLREQITAAFSELKKTEQTVKNREQRQRLAVRRKEQAVSDEIGLQLHRRKG
jgi:predicted  nucleic acid-binding Zn-ribbon protein